MGKYFASTVRAYDKLRPTFYVLLPTLLSSSYPLASHVITGAYAPLYSVSLHPVASYVALLIL